MDMLKRLNSNTFTENDSFERASTVNQPNNLSINNGALLNAFGDLHLDSSDF